MARRTRRIGQITVLLFVSIFVVGGVVGVAASFDIRTLTALTQAAAGVIGIEMAVDICPNNGEAGPGTNPYNWTNVVHERRNNCYHYASNHPQDTFNLIAGGGQPGGGVVSPPTGSDALGKCTADGLLVLGTGVTYVTGTCTVGCPIALVVGGRQTGTYFVTMTAGTRICTKFSYEPNDGDFHFYRRNVDGTWSHKPGSTRYTYRDAQGQTVTNPVLADRRWLSRGSFRDTAGVIHDFVGTEPGYPQYVGCLCVPNNGVTIRGEEPPAAPPVSPTDMVVDVVTTSGFPHPNFTYSGPTADSVASLYLSGLPPTSNPNWPDYRLGPRGYHVEIGSLVGGGGYPHYLRVWNGTIEALDPSGNLIGYFIDLHGFEGFLKAQACLAGAAPCRSVCALCPTAKADVDGNSARNGQDIGEFVQCYMAQDAVFGFCPCADMDGNGVLNQADVTSFVNCLLGLGCPP